MINIKPILINDLFPILNSKLISLLEGIHHNSWYKPTACKEWCVKDIVQHLVKDYIGVLSQKRDKYKNPKIKGKKFKLQGELVKYINEINQTWVDATKQVSPKVLIQFLKFLGDELFKYFYTVNLMKVESRVSWISDERLPNWMDVAREYTEYWLHQAHIRDAVDAHLLTEKKLFHPFIQAYMMTLPKTYRNVNSKVGTKIAIQVTGSAGGNWLLEKIKGDWQLSEERSYNNSSTVIIDQDTLWRLFSKGIDKKSAESKIVFKGNQKLGKNILNTISLIV